MQFLMCDSVNKLIIGIFIYVYHWARCIEDEMKNDMFHAIVIKLFGSGELPQQRLLASLL
jgi:hypothetical protein